MLLIGLIAVLALSAVVVKKEAMKPYYRSGQPVPLGSILPLDQVTVNMQDGHLVQASIALQLTKVANSKLATADIPRFENSVITILGAQSYSGLLAPQARAAVNQEILRACQGILSTTDGHAPQVSAIYFTGFVIQ